MKQADPGFFPEEASAGKLNSGYWFLAAWSNLKNILKLLT